MDSIAEIFNDSKPLLTEIDNFFSKYIGARLLRQCGITKVVDTIERRKDPEVSTNPLFRLIGDVSSSRFLAKCVSAKTLLKDKLLLGFRSASAFRMFRTGSFFGDYKKDTFYRFDRMPGANWERLQRETARNVIEDLEASTSKGHPRALIFDDSLYERTGGKGTDLCAKVFDHTDRKMRTGFRMMTGGWTNGEVFIPFTQALLTTRKDALMVGPDERVDGRTLSGRRRMRAKTKGTDVVRMMVQEAQQLDIPFDYVLFDTWFSNPAQLVELKNMDADVIAMIKKGSTKYQWTNPETGETKRLDVKEIYARNRKRRGRSKYLLSVGVEVSDKSGNTIPAKLVYVRNRNNRKDWICLVCTNMEMSEEEIIQAYSLRWSIETYFKMSKSYLKLRTECHSTSYDAITSHMVVVAIRYMILAVQRFQNNDTRSLAELFDGIQREIASELMDMAIELVLDAMLDSVRETFQADEAKIDALVRNFINKLPEQWRCRFQVSSMAA